MTNHHTTIPRFFTLREVSERTGVPFRKLREMALTEPPAFEHIHIGRVRYMTAEQLTKFMASRTKTTVSAPAMDPDLAAVKDRVERQRRRKAAQATAGRAA